MPSYRCDHSSCTELLDAKGFCAKHAHEAGPSVVYDKYKRDPAAKKFYNSAAWKRCRAAKVAAQPTCERCKVAFTDHVHHIIPLSACTPEQKLDHSNLRCTCIACHPIEEAESRRREEE